MKTITIAETSSGFLVVSGELGYTEKPKELFIRSHAFNSLDKAVAHIRKKMKLWSEPTPPISQQAPNTPPNKGMQVI